MDSKLIDKLQKQYMPLPKFPAETPVAMAYIPFQQFGGLYDSSKALETGTIFMELDKPFTGKVNVK